MGEIGRNTDPHKVSGIGLKKAKFLSNDVADNRTGGESEGRKAEADMANTKGGEKDRTWLSGDAKGAGKTTRLGWKRKGWLGEVWEGRWREWVGEGGGRPSPE